MCNKLRWSFTTNDNGLFKKFKFPKLLQNKYKGVINTQMSVDNINIKKKMLNNKIYYR